MRLLLDTHAFLWWIADDPQLSARARAVIGDAGNETYVSVVNACEIAIKARPGRLDIPADVPGFVARQIERNAFGILPAQLAHALRVHGLDDHHQDPFDRLLVAQAEVEGMALVTADHRLRDYGVPLV